MKASLDREGCIACGLCPTICPEVFRMADDGFAEVYNEDVPVEVEEQAVEAQESCPVSVILIE
jgi:ferredoxin